MNMVRIINIEYKEIHLFFDTGFQLHLMSYETYVNVRSPNYLLTILHYVSLVKKKIHISAFCKLSLKKMNHTIL